jgi:hypothetical protein
MHVTVFSGPRADDDSQAPRLLLAIGVLGVEPAHLRHENFGLNSTCVR